MLKFLLVCLVIYLLVRLILSFTRENTYSNSHKTNAYSNRQEGEITIEGAKTSKNKRVSDTDGEYVNYEEL